MSVPNPQVRFETLEKNPSLSKAMEEAAHEEGQEILMSVFMDLADRSQLRLFIHPRILRAQNPKVLQQFAEKVKAMLDVSIAVVQK